MGAVAAPFSKKHIHTIKTQRAMSFQFFLKDQRESPDVSISECMSVEAKWSCGNGMLRCQWRVM